MDNETRVKERVGNDLAEHVVTVLHSDGLYRHWRCQKPGTGMMGFDIVTWPGSLCFTGDMGELKEKIRRLEAPVGSYSRDGAVASQECLSVYLALNPRSLVKANKSTLLEMARRMMDGPHDFSAVSVAMTEVHRAVDRKFFIDFDFDDAEPAAYLERIREILPEARMWRIIRTRGGFHLIVVLEAIRELKTQWHRELTALAGCDVRGTKSLTPVPGCTQGGFTPHFWQEEERTG